MKRIIPEIIEQHAEEAAFLWLMRDDAVGRPDYDLAALIELDERIQAHLDGLQLADDEGWSLLKTGLEIGEPGEVFAAGVIAFENGSEDRIQNVLDVIAEKPENGRAAASALGWLSYEKAETPIRALLSNDSPAIRRIGLAGAAIHRRNPGGKLLNEALAHEDMRLRERALRAIGELGLMDMLPIARRNMRSEDIGCRLSAARSVALCSPDGPAIDELKAIAESGPAFQEGALQIAMRRLELSAAQAWQKRLADRPHLACLALIGAGVLGDPQWIPWIIDHMQFPQLARPAGEAFSLITGAHISYDGLECEPPEDFEAGPTEDPADENVAMDPDENLPWPDPALVRKWWADHNSRFTAGMRYLAGKPLSIETAKAALREGSQRIRAGAALELAILQRGQKLFEVRAPGFRQKEML